MTKKIMLYVNSSKTGADEIAESNFEINSKYIGINCGTLGFMQDFVYDKDIPFIKQLEEAEEDVIRFLGITIETNDNIYKFNAINDFVVQNNNLKVLHANVYIDNEYLENFVGTGIAFATQIGSTARNISSGGNIIYPGVDTICMTPIEPTCISKFRTLRNGVCLPSSVKAQIVPSNLDEVNIVADGMSCFVGKCEKMEVQYNNKYMIRLLRKNTSFTKKINETFI